jgi:CubicO group peptidase (beta-lactamase class C family)
MMVTLRVLVVCLAVAVGVLSVPVRAAEERRFAQVRDWILAAIESGGVPSLAVAVARDGRILWEEGFGWADREQRRPATPHTPYPLASVSKPFTATALMVLVEQGRVSLDAPVNDYLGAAPLRARVGDPAEATVRRVATHTAGLPLHHHFFHLDEPRRPPAIEETIRRYGNLVTEPGERFRYSNLGYGVLEHVVERVSGDSFEHFMRTAVFEPLGLRDTFVAGPGERPDRPRAVSYAQDGSPLVFYDFDHRGGSAMFGSAHDLARFGSFHVGRPFPGTAPLLSRRGLTEMHQPFVATDMGGAYGVGWRIDRTPQGFLSVSHSGGMPGVSTLLTLVPAERIAIAVLANSRTGLPQVVSERILARLLPHLHMRASPFVMRSPPTVGRQAPAQVPAPPRRFKPPKRLVGTWEGTVSTYAGELPVALSVGRSGEVRLSLDGGPATTMATVEFRDGLLRAVGLGRLGTPEADRLPHALLFELMLRGTVLNGAVTAVATPRHRAGYALSHWAELRRAP